MMIRDILENKLIENPNSEIQKMVDFSKSRDRKNRERKNNIKTDRKNDITEK